MSEWQAKRFWKEARVEKAGDGYEVLLDGRKVRTPAKTPLIVPTRALADEIANEWQAQSEVIKPESMPYTRSANAAIDKVTPQFGEVADLLAAYGDSDLLCYRANSPAELVARQSAAWDPLLDWAATTLGVRLSPRIGVMHLPQSPQALDRLRVLTHALTPFQLTAFHDLVSISGSLIIGFAATRKHLDPETLWSSSRIDESWQAEQWGEDDEATKSEAVKKAAFGHGFAFFHRC